MYRRSEADEGDMALIVSLLDPESRLDYVAIKQGLYISVKRFPYAIDAEGIITVFKQGSGRTLPPGVFQRDGRGLLKGCKQLHRNPGMLSENPILDNDVMIDLIHSRLPEKIVKQAPAIVRKQFPNSRIVAQWRTGISIDGIRT